MQYIVLLFLFFVERPKNNQLKQGKPYKFIFAEQ